MSTTASSEPRKPRPGYHLCPKHDVEYGALEQCGVCASGDRAEPTATKRAAAPKPPAGCRSIEQHERWLTKLADDALRDVQRLRKTKGKDWHTEVAIKGHRDTAIKAARAATELAAIREDAHLLDDRLKGDEPEAAH